MFDQARQDNLSRQKNALDIDLENTLPFVIGDLDRRLYRRDASANCRFFETKDTHLVSVGRSCIVH